MNDELNAQQNKQTEHKGVVDKLNQRIQEHLRTITQQKQLLNKLNERKQFYKQMVIGRIQDGGQERTNAQNVQDAQNDINDDDTFFNQVSKEVEGE
jgi:hypothetical protein